MAGFRGTFTFTIQNKVYASCLTTVFLFYLCVFNILIVHVEVKQLRPPFYILLCWIMAVGSGCVTYKAFLTYKVNL